MSTFTLRFLRLLAISACGLAASSCVTIPPPDVSVYNLEHKITGPYIQPVSYEWHPVCW